MSEVSTPVDLSQYETGSVASPGITQTPMSREIPVKELIRAEISEVGDDKTQIGILSDGLLAATYSLSFLIVAISESKDMDELKTKLNTDLIPLSKMIQDDIKGGNLRLSYLAKEGRSLGAFNSLAALSNKVSDVIEKYKVVKSS